MKPFQAVPDSSLPGFKENWIISTAILLWASHDVQMRVRRPGPHDVGAGRPVFGREPGNLRIEWPHDHPVRADRDGSARGVLGIRITALSGAGQHVGDAWDRVSRLRFVSFGVGEPLERKCINAHRWVGHNFWISRHATEAVIPFAQNYCLALCVGVYDPCSAGDVRWPGGHRSGYLRLHRIAGIRRRNLIRRLRVSYTSWIRSIHK